MGAANPAARPIFELNLQPGATFFKHGELSPTVERPGKLQGITLSVAFAHSRFRGNHNAMTSGGMLGMDDKDRPGKEYKEAGRTRHEPEE